MPRDYGQMYGYRSGLEETVAAQLTALSIPYEYEAVQYDYPKKQKVKASLTEDMANPITGIYLILHYTPDFLIIKKSGAGMVIETKGRFLAADREKIRILKKTRPWLDFRMIFTNPKARFSKTNTKTYADFCEQLGIPYAKGKIPDEWLKEIL